MGKFERGIQTDVIEEATARYGSRIFIRVKHGDAYSVAGDPDIYGCLDGFFFGFEVKNEEGKLSRIQQYRLRELHGAGAKAGAIRDKREALEMLSEIDLLGRHL